MQFTPIQFSRYYGFIRARQLDGTFPGDRGTGIWPITSHRVGRGWGAVLENEWARLPDDPWPPPEPPGLDRKAKTYRTLTYERITSVEECKLAVYNQIPVLVSLEITAQWDRAEMGIIEMPKEGDEIIGSHAVTLVGYSDSEQRFTFRNCWGEGWGDKGYGYLPYEYFDYTTEAWISGGLGQTPPVQAVDLDGVTAWATPDFAGRIFHCREFVDLANDERIGWAFAVQDAEYLNVEEFFVRPQYRRKGYGARLLRSLEQLSQQVGVPLQFFVPLADCKPENLHKVEKLLSKAGYCLHKFPLPYSRLCALKTVDLNTLSLDLPSPPALVSPSARFSRELMQEFTYQQVNGDEFEPVGERNDLLKQPDWKSKSDSAFVKAAKATLHRHADLLRRLA